MVYLDYSATTFASDEVIATFSDAAKNYAGNPNSQHKLGVRNKKRIDDATINISKILNVLPEEIIYTSGSSESNNLAIKGICASYKGKHIITTKMEHSSVVAPINRLCKNGYEVDFVKLNSDGSIDIDNLPISKKARYKKFLSLFKDADKLDRVRLSTSPQIGLDTSRLSFNISKQYENVAYESYEKLLDLFSLLKKERLLEEMIETTKEYEVIAEFRRKLDAKRKELEERNRRVLEEIKEKEREMNNARNI